MPGGSIKLLLAATLLLLAPQAVLAGEWDFSGDTGSEFRWFPADPAFPGQEGGPGYSAMGNLEWRWRSIDGYQRASIRAFGRLDSMDSRRTHADLREAYWAYEGEDWEVLAGFNKVFWGVTESRHLVDVINQTDLVEDPDQEQKLGQPMVNLMLRREWGQLDVFVMPWFRERTFPGTKSRLRPPLPVDTGRAVYESSAKQQHTDFALRYSHYFGDVDIGAYYFRGTSREPTLVRDVESASLVPFYSQMDQIGADIQYTRDAWLWKLEAIARNGVDETFFASVAGFEYTFYGIRESAADVGLLMEYLYDGRGASEPATPFDDDLFIGTRLSLNDMQDSNFLIGVILDRDTSDYFFNLEAERRFGENITAELRLRLFRGDEATDPLHAFDRDDYLQLNLSRHF
jgi:hypothetical protein